MTAADKVKLDETLPQQIAKEIQDRKDAIEALKCRLQTCRISSRYR